MILIGNRGVGKTYFGEKLAPLLNVEFYDTDIYYQLLHRETVKEAIERDESDFRAKEYGIVRLILSTCHPNSIIAVGGGFPISDQNKQLLKHSGHSILWIQCEEHLRKSRVAESDRPKLDDSGRDEHYNQICDDILVLGETKKCV